MKIGSSLDFDDLLVQMGKIPSELAILPINDAVVFPLMMVPLILRDSNLLRLADEALERPESRTRDGQPRDAGLGVGAEGS